jgi:hypothetical protein
MQTWLHDSSETYPEQQIVMLNRATVVASSAADSHPVLHLFDEHTGPGGTQWIAAEPGDQICSLPFINQSPFDELPSKLRNAKSPAPKKWKSACRRTVARRIGNSVDRSLHSALTVPPGNAKIGTSQKIM